MCYNTITMEKFPKDRDVVKGEIRGILKDTQRSRPSQPPKDQKSISMLDTIEAPQIQEKEKIFVKPRKIQLDVTQDDIPTPGGETKKVISVADENLPIAEEFKHAEEFKKVQKEIARNLFNRAILNDDISLAFDQFNILKRKGNPDLEDEKFQLLNLIKKIQYTEKARYQEAVAKFETDDPKRFVAARRKALIDESLGKYKQAIESNLEHVDLPDVIQELADDGFPKPIITETISTTRKNISDAQIEMLPQLYHRAINQKDYFMAYNQLMIAKEIDQEKYKLYSTQMLVALNAEIDAIEKSIAEEKERINKETQAKKQNTLLKKIVNIFKKPEPEINPTSEVLRIKEKTLTQLQELKKVI